MKPEAIQVAPPTDARCEAVTWLHHGQRCTRRAKCFVGGKAMCSIHARKPPIDAGKVLELLDEGLTCGQIARRYGSTDGTISRIARQARDAKRQVVMP